MLTIYFITTRFIIRKLNVILKKGFHVFMYIL